jgi:hypothetical protein
MIVLAAALIAFAAAVCQVSVAPLFPLNGAVVDVVLVTVVVLALSAGPRTAMVAMPFAALFFAFLSGRSPALILLAYLPLLPLAAYLEEAPVPLNRFWRLIAAIALAGSWARFVLAGAAYAQGAEFSVFPLIFDVLLPGLILDVLAVTILYLPRRLVGWQPQALSLRRTGWY